MEPWIFATLAAATLQTVRFMLQKVLSQTKLSTLGATFSRFCFSAPLLWLVMVVYFASTLEPLPALSLRFWVFASFGGLVQIIATICVVALFKSRNFAVGITFKKTEVIQAVFVGLVLLGEGVSLVGFAAILIGLFGVIMLSDQKTASNTGGHRFFNQATGLGLASGFLFAISAVAYRGATLEVTMPSPLLTAAVTLLMVITFQSVVMAVWIYLRDRPQFRAVWNSRTTAVWVGITSLGGSLGWFTAFALQNAAYVKALGQIEIILSVMVGYFLFKERLAPREVIAMSLLVISILMLILLT